MSLLVNPFVPAFNGPIISPGAEISCYYTTTLTLAPITNADGAPLDNPVPSGLNGQFPAIYLDPTITYRVILRTAGGVVLGDIDPYYTSTSSIGAIFDDGLWSANAEVTDDGIWG